MTLEDAERLEAMARAACAVLDDRGTATARAIARRAADHARALVRLIESRDRADSAGIDVVGDVLPRVVAAVGAQGPRVAVMLAELHRSTHVPWELSTDDLGRVLSHIPTDDGYAALRQSLESRA